MMARVQNVDGAAIEALLQKIATLMHRFAMHMCRRQADAEDVSPPASPTAKRRGSINSASSTHRPRRVAVVHYDANAHSPQPSDARLQHGAGFRGAYRDFLQLGSPAPSRSSYMYFVSRASHMGPAQRMVSICIHAGALHRSLRQFIAMRALATTAPTQRDSAAVDVLRGRTSRNMVAPSEQSTSSPPPCARAIALAMNSPRPSPSPRFA
jgi:hypothetical protein